MAELEIVDCCAYLDRLMDVQYGAAELDALATSLTIGETFFFRHAELFDALCARVLPELIERNRPCRRLRIWSAGCAIGAEPYSLAILLRQHFGPQLADWNVDIVGTDINRHSLVQAERGEFGDWSLRSLSDDVKASCFVRTGSTWAIKPEYRRNMSFQYHNLVQHPFPSLANGLSAFDLILCRNVMIYFEPTVIHRLVGQFYDALVEGGCLAVGPTEPSVSLFRAFETLNLPEAILYRKGAATPADLGSEHAASALAPSASKAETMRRSTVALQQVSTQPAATVLRHATAACRRPFHPLSAQPVITLADVRMKLNRGQADEAYEFCRILLAAERLNPAVHFYHALVSGQQGRHTESEQALRRAIYLDRDLVLAHYHLAIALHRNREVGASVRSFRNVLALLRQRDDAEVLLDADNMTVGELRQLTEMHLEVLNRT